MAGKWTTAVLGDLCEFRAGSVFKPALQGQPSGSYPFVKVSDMNRPANAVRIQDANNWVSEQDLKELRARPFPVGTVVFAKIGEALRQNRLRQVARETVVDNNMMGAVPRTAYVEPRFFYYALSKFDFSDLAQGTALPFLTISSLSGLTLDVPPLPEQRAIAHILGTLDDKIELNRQMNETLEAMARALFKSWFVDFDPVRAKVEGRDPGLPKPLADLFPNSFEDSELGEIPKGWAAVPLSAITSVITKGTTPTQEDTKSAREANARINYVRVNAIGEDGEILFDKLTTIPESVHLGVLNRSVLRANDVLYTIAGTIGRISVVEGSLLPANTNQAVAIVRPKPKIPPAFLVLAMWGKAFRDELHSNIVQAVQANLSLGMLSGARIVVPPKNTMLQLFMPIDELMNRIGSNRAESRTLAALRDTLLPKLISGELRVKDAERFVSESPVEQ